MEDRQLIDAYACQKSESAFRALVERHGPLVYNSALRQVGNPQQAEDVAQAVFILLARKAGHLSKNTLLAGWLFRTTRFVAARAIRSEQRRRRREEEALEMQNLTKPDETWQRLAPVIDEALSKLNRADRDALLLRYFAGKSLRDVGQTLGSTEEAAKKRVTRALEKLRQRFAQQGIGLSAVTLSAALAAKSEAALPASLASINFLSAGASSSAAGLVETTEAGWRLIRLKWAVAAICTTALSLPAIQLLTKERNLTGQTASVRPTQAATEEAPPEIPPANASPAPATPARTFTLHVVDAATGAGLPHARVAINTVRGWDWTQDYNLATDAAGLCTVALPEETSRLDIGVISDGWEARYASWPSEGHRGIPDSYTLRVNRVEQTMGGLVVDPNGRPLARVEIRFQAHGGGDSAHRQRPQERFGFIGYVPVAETDDDGRWQIGFIPEENPGFALMAQHADYSETYMINNDEERGQLWTGELVTRMKPAFVLTGTVRNQAGTPLTGAQVQAREQQPIFKTDSVGRFRIPGLAAGARAFTFMAEGYAPRRVPFNIGPNLAPAEVVLGPAATLRLHVVDKDGFSVAGARVGLEQWGEHRSALEWTAQSDAAGTVEWRSAPPATDLELYAKKDGYAYTRDIHLQADGQEHQIVLVQALVVHGKVLDAESGEPIPNFHVVPSYGKHYWDMGLSWLYGEAVRGTNGIFKFTFDDDSPPWLLRIEAQGYDEWTSRNLEGPSPLQLEIPLKPTSAEEVVRGVVLRPDGAPATEAQVALLSFEHNVGLENFRFRGNDRWLTQPDAGGSFQFPYSRLAHTVAAVSKEGFARQRLNAAREPVRLILQPWGRIEGMVDARAWTRPIETIHLFDPAADNYQGRVSLREQAKPGPLGRFTFENVPPGDYSVYLSSGAGPFHHGTPLHVAPGETTQVIIRETPGFTVRGRFVPAPGKPVDWIKDHVAATLYVLPNRRVRTHPETTEAGMWEALNFWTSPEGRAYVNTPRQYSLQVLEDGSFVSMVGVPPGQYRLSAAFGLHTNYSFLSQETSIPEAAGEEGEIDLGALNLR